MHGNATAHLKNTDSEKIRLSARYEGYMRQVELWQGKGEGGALLWDKWAVFFNIQQSSVNFRGAIYDLQPHYM